MWSDNAGRAPDRLRRLQRRGRGARDRRRRASGSALAGRRRPPPHRRPLAPHRRHLRGRHASPRYLDGERVGAPQPATLATATTGELLAARIPAGATVAYDELAVYPRALDAATHRRALRRLRQRAARARPQTSRPTARRQRGHAQLDRARRHRPGRAAPVDHYVAEAWQGTTLRGAQAVDGAAHERHAQRPARGRLHAQACARSTASAPAPTPRDGHRRAAPPATYAGAVTDDAPELYWRLGERSGTLLADASGHGHAAALRRARRTSAPTRAA